MKRVVIIEDDADLLALLKYNLEKEGFEAHGLQSGKGALELCSQVQPGVVLLDIMLPSRDGFDIATEIRKYNQKLPIVFLTAKGQTSDRIRGFQAGADDYICKPFSIEEFRYRIEAILKRSGVRSAHQEAGTLHAGSSVLDVNNLLLNSNGLVTRLTYKEAKLLEMLFRNPDKLMERDIFLKAIWEEDGFFVARSMDVFVSRVRKYLKQDASLKIENVRGIGYVMKTSSEVSAEGAVNTAKSL